MGLPDGRMCSTLAKPAFSRGSRISSRKSSSSKGFCLFGVLRQRVFRLLDSPAGNDAQAVMLLDGGRDRQTDFIKELFGKAWEFDRGPHQTGLLFDRNKFEQGCIQEPFLKESQTLGHLFRGAGEMHSLEISSVLIKIS